MIEKMQNVAWTLLSFLGFLALLDLMIVMATIGQIASGQYTPHIPFWDAQIKVFINLIS